MPMDEYRKQKAEKVRLSKLGLQGMEVDPIYRNREAICKVIDVYTDKLGSSEHAETKNWTSDETFEVFSLKQAFASLDETKLCFIQ